MTTDEPMLDSGSGGAGRGRARPKVAIACPGVGLVQRGFERLFTDLFRLVADDLDITLFKGGGISGDGERKLRFLPRNGLACRLLPVHRLVGRTAMHTECLTFALALLWAIRGKEFDIVHCIDPPLTRVLYKLRDAMGLKFRILYTEGCAMPPGDYPPCDHLHQIAEVTYQEALQAALPPDYMTLVPAGIYPERFATTCGKSELRRAYGVPEDTFVILSVAALNRGHKRTDYLIDEVSRLNGPILLWLDGSLDHGEPDLVDYAKSRLGDRVRVTHVPSAMVGELHRMADVMVHCAVFEAFGLAVVEAAANGVPLLIHNAPHFQWLVPNPECWVDMTQPGALAGRLGGIMATPSGLEALRCQESALQQFSWENLRAPYLALYRHVQGLPVGGARTATESRG